MYTRQRTTRGEAGSRVLPWSTRAVIFLAFAIQLGPVSHRLYPLVGGEVDCLSLCDGRLLAIWLSDADQTQAGVIQTPTASRVPDQGARPIRPVIDPLRLAAALDQVGEAILPIPPPATC